MDAEVEVRGQPYEIPLVKRIVLEVCAKGCMFVAGLLVGLAAGFGSTGNSLDALLHAGISMCWAFFAELCLKGWNEGSRRWVVSALALATLVLLGVDLLGVV